MEKRNSKIIKNTLILYIRMIFALSVTIYTSRIVLNCLGVNDFGIFNIVGGIVTVFSLVNSSLRSATQRFITYDLGAGSEQKLKETFSTILTLHILLVIVIFILAETIGLWFLNAHMNIDKDRMFAANVVYQCTLIAFLMDVLSVPYNALINAHERMSAFAYITIIEVVAKLLIALVISFSVIDKLIVYAILIMAVSLLIRYIYLQYCRKNFPESKFVFSLQMNNFRQIALFSGWNFIGTSSAVFSYQGVNILINLFFGVVANAAQGIASQVQSAIGGFVSNFMVALNPQITKSYAGNDWDYMKILIIKGARFSFYLMFLFSLPFLIETEIVLKLWLKIVPEYSVIFVRLTLIVSIVQTLSNPLITGMLATGKIKNYQIIVGGIQMLNFPVSYVALRLGFQPQSTLVIAIIISLICLIARLYLLRSMIKLPVITYFNGVILKVIVVSSLSVIVPLVVYHELSYGIPRLFYVCCTCFLSTSIVIFVTGLSKSERRMVFNLFLTIKGKYGFKQK